MTRRLVFADSEVAAIAVSAGALRLRFAAAHVLEADAGTFSGWRTGHLTDVVLTATADDGWATDPAQVGRLAEGRLVRAEGVVSELPLPFEVQGPMRLELRFANGVRLDVAVRGLRVDAPPGAAFSESLAC